MNPEWIGSIAAFFTTAAYVPQVLKAWREKHTSGVSLAMYAMITTGIALWCVYGVLIGSPSVTFANAIGFLLALAVLLMKIRHG
ncbi:MAG: SemiSWEET family sugar transporter [Pseudomonadota bacterium]|nr:SemiSWEET family sugar transporter [Pseudomonadota bacterium]